MNCSLYLLLAAYLLSDQVTDCQITGNFDMQSGSTCSYNVMDFAEDSKVGLRIKCSCKGGGGSKHKKIEYSCVYFGNPFNCYEYLEDREHLFFKEMVNYIKDHGSHACMNDELDAGRITNVCKGQQIKFKRTEKINGGDPRHCVKEQHTEL